MSAFSLELPRDRLDLPLCVGCGQVFRWSQAPGPPDQWVGADGENWYRVEIQAGEGSTTLRVETNGDAHAFQRLFRLDVDESRALASIVDAEPALAPYVAALPGLRLMRPSDAVEAAFSFLCTPNNHLVRILRMVRVLASYGEPFAGAPEGVRRFPSLEAIAGLSEAELRARGFGYRGRTIPSIARQMMERGGADWLASLKSLPYGEAHEALIRLNGVGRKLADCICLFALHHEEAVPVDTHLWQAAVRLYFPEWKGKALTDQRYRAVGEAFRARFGPLSGWAHQYLFYDNLLHGRSRRAQRSDG